MKPRLVIVGNPGCRRVGFWLAAALRRGWPPSQVVPYSAILREQISLAQLLSPPALVRIECAAENADTYKLLLQHGAEPALQHGYPALDSKAIAELVPERGWIVKPRQVYLGFVRLLHSLREVIYRSKADALNHADDIALFFHKPRCQERLAQAGIPVPVSLGAFRNYEDVRTRLRDAGRLMVKPAHGSGGAGCMALHCSQGRVRALTTLVPLLVNDEERLYCSKKVRVLLDELEIARLVNWLCTETAQVEEWLPKARWQGCSFDLRVVTIAGQARHAMARFSNTPFTNLTLGNRRGDMAAIVTKLGPQVWQGMRDTCARVARAFPRSYTLGIDLLLRPDWKRWAVLEINAFGEQLFGQTEQGEDTYTAALTAWERGDRVGQLEAAS